MSKVDILAYIDYRDYLAHLFDEKKASDKKFSFAKCAEALGTTKSYLKLVIQKKRHSSQDRLWSIAQLFELNEFDRQYLVFSFLSATTQHKEMKGYFDDVLRGLRARIEFGSRYVESSVDTEAVFRGSLEMAIHGLVNLKDFRPDPEWISKKLGGDPIQVADVEVVLKNFIENEIIVMKDGRYESKEFVFREQSPADRDNFKVYQIGLQQGILATSDLKRFRPSHFQMMTLSLSHEDEKRVFDKYIAFRDELIDISKNSKDPEVLHFVSNSIFAVTPP